MKSKEKKDISQNYFWPLDNFRYNQLFHPSVADNKQMVLAKNLHRSYNIPEGNILRLIMYTEIALHWTGEDGLKLYYSDLSGIADFGKNPEPVEKIVFRGKTKSFELSSPYLTDNLYRSLLEIIDFRKITDEKPSGRKPASKTIIKKVATDLYEELTEKENITGSKPLYIIGYIFSLYNVGLKNSEHVLTEKEFKNRQEEQRSEGIAVSESYLQYLGRLIKPYIDWKNVREIRKD